MSLVTQISDLATRVALEIKNHKNATSGAHAASAISFSPTGTIAGTNVQTALAEVASEAERAWTYEVRSTDYTNSTTTETDVFTGFTPAANTNYEVEVFAVVFTVVGTTGFQGGLGGPATGTNLVMQMVAFTNNTQGMNWNSINTFGVITAGSASTTNSAYTVKSLVQMGASPGAGNIRFIAKSEIAASQITLKAGSYMRWRIAPA